MRNFFGLAILGCAMLSVVPANAGTTNYNFNFTSGTTNSDLNSYSNTSNAITATAVAFYVTGTSSGPGSTSKFTSGTVGEYNGAGMGICETQTGNNCSDPNHQIDNGTNLNLNNNNGSVDDFEFMLIQFSASVNLSDITLGNFGTTGSGSSPFNATFLTSNSSDTLSQMEAALGATTAGGLANTNGFGGAQQTSCNNSNCAVNDVGANDPLTGTGVTFLLIGASDASGAAGTDFFKVQDLAAYNAISGQSPTPEPATFGLLGLALTGLGVYGRKRKSSRN
jgi:hypothetical protein